MEDWLHRIYEDMIGRISGSMKFRLVLQPLMAAFFAIRSGIKDAKKGRTPYFWALLSRPQKRGSLFHEGWKDVGRVFLLAIAIDAIYQWIELKAFYPVEALIVAVALAILPYLFLRGLTDRIARLRKEDPHERQ